eukprot:COSAG01_NODE_25277_length_750_cov_0.990783_1_plen_106_part_10
MTTAPRAQLTTLAHACRMVPTDCDNRDERLGWTGDSALSSVEASLNYDMGAFYDNWARMLDVRTHYMYPASMSVHRVLVIRVGHVPERRHRLHRPRSRGRRQSAGR